jgi:hypothetical protein
MATTKKSVRGRARPRQASKVTKTTTDHETIRRWVEKRGGTPAHVKSTGRKGDLGMIRIDFPGWSGAGTLEAVDWDDWFEAFDDNNLAFVYEERMADGKPSRFNKLVARETVRRRAAGESSASVHKARKSKTVSASRRRAARPGSRRRAPSAA